MNRRITRKDFCAYVCSPVSFSQAGNNGNRTSRRQTNSHITHTCELANSDNNMLMNETAVQIICSDCTSRLCQAWNVIFQYRPITKTGLSHRPTRPCHIALRLHGPMPNKVLTDTLVYYQEFARKMTIFVYKSPPQKTTGIRAYHTEWWGTWKTFALKVSIRPSL